MIAQGQLNLKPIDFEETKSQNRSTIGESQQSTFAERNRLMIYTASHSGPKAR